MMEKQSPMDRDFAGEEGSSGCSSFVYPEVKRLYECRMADPAFMELLKADPEGTLEKIQVRMPASKALSIAEECGRSGWDKNPWLSLYRPRLDLISAEISRRMDASRYKDPALYRYAQIVRNRIFLYNRIMQGHQNIRYFPAAIELSSGCSVQCPFCGLDARPLAGNAAYGDCGILWKEILEILKGLIGPVADTVPCYYATEPLDNPDYERFLSDYRKVLGALPQTTTAIADRDPARLRSLLSLIGKEELSHAALRISVRTKRQLYRLMESYTPSELEDVELILNNKEALHYYSDSGRMRLHHDSPLGIAKPLRYTIACIAGLIINLCDRTVSFVEPELPSERFPLGMRIYESRSFTDAASFERAAKELFALYVRDRIREDDLLCFDEEIRVSREGFQFLFSGDGKALRMGVNRVAAGCLESILQKPVTVKELSREQGLSAFVMDSVKEKLDILFQKGFLRCVPNAARQTTE